ncbi:MAG TPA: MFS transporter [Chloroflexota bacterium]|nr:MFS transporter [Chloroflexota bacterium]
MPNRDTTRPAGAAARAGGAPRGLWRDRDFVKVLAGETVSELGSHVGGLALPLAAVLALEATPGQMAALRAAHYVPRILVGLVAGVWIDRLRRRPVMIATNLVRAALLLAVAVTAGLGLLRVELLYAAGLLMAVLGVVFGTAFAAYLPSLVPGRSLVAANGARATSSAATEVLGPGLAGLLIQSLGVPGVIAIDGVSFLASALGLALVRTPEPAPPPPARRRRLQVELGEGMRALMGHPILRAFLATAFTAQFFYSVIMAVYVVYLARELGLPPAALGVIFGLGGGVGVLAGSASAARVARALGLGRTLVGAHLLFGVLGLPLMLAVAWPALAAPLVFAAELTQLAANAVYMVNRVSVEQAVTPVHLRGRVQAGQTVAHALSGALGLACGGALGEGIGLSAAITVGVVGGLCSFLWLWCSPVRHLRW